MNCEKYIGLDIHQATISVAVMDPMGKLIMESILETKASTILEFLGGLRGTLSVTFEEGTWAGWLYDLLKPHTVTKTSSIFLDIADVVRDVEKVRFRVKRTKIRG